MTNKEKHSLVKYANKLMHLNQDPINPDGTGGQGTLPKVTGMLPKITPTYNEKREYWPGSGEQQYLDMQAMDPRPGFEQYIRRLKNKPYKERTDKQKYLTNIKTRFQKIPVPHISESDLIPFGDSEATPLEWYNNDKKPRGTTEAGDIPDGHPYLEIADPDIHKRVQRDVGLMSQQGLHGGLNPSGLFHMHTFKHPERGRGINYHVREFQPNKPQGSHHNFVSYLNEEGIRAAGPANYRAGISGAGTGHGKQSPGGYQASFRPKGTGYGDTWKKDHQSGWGSTGIPFLPNMRGRKKPTYDNKQQFLDSINTAYPRPESIGGPWTK